MNEDKIKATMNNTIALIILFGLISCNGQYIDTQAEGEKLMQLSREWSKTAATGDIEKTLEYWADDAVMMLPKQRPIKGKEELRGMLQASYQMPGFKISWEPLSVSVSKSGDMAYMIEKSQATINDSLGHPLTEYHQSVTIWRKEADGKWRNVVDMWNEEAKK